MISSDRSFVEGGLQQPSLLNLGGPNFRSSKKGTTVLYITDCKTTVQEDKRCAPNWGHPDSLLGPGQPRVKPPEKQVHGMVRVQNLLPFLCFWQIEWRFKCLQAKSGCLQANRPIKKCMWNKTPWKADTTAGKGMQLVSMCNKSSPTTNTTTESWTRKSAKCKRTYDGDSVKGRYSYSFSRSQSVPYLTHFRPDLWKGPAELATFCPCLHRQIEWCVKCLQAKPGCLQANRLIKKCMWNRTTWNADTTHVTAGKGTQVCNKSSPTKNTTIDSWRQELQNGVVGNTCNMSSSVFPTHESYSSIKRSFSRFLSTIEPMNAGFVTRQPIWIGNDLVSGKCNQENSCGENAFLTFLARAWST